MDIFYMRLQRESFGFLGYLAQVFTCEQEALTKNAYKGQNNPNPPFIHPRSFTSKEPIISFMQTLRGLLHPGLESSQAA